MTWFQRPRDPQEQHGFDLIGATIKRRRASLGWTQRYLEAQCGIDQTVISRIENGKQYGLRWSRFADLVDALGGFDVALGPVGLRPVRAATARDAAAAATASRSYRPGRGPGRSRRRGLLSALARVEGAH